MRYILLLIVFLLPCLSHADDVYRWTDDQGNVYLSDKPHRGAEKVVIPKEDKPSTQHQDYVPEVMPVMPQVTGDTEQPSTYQDGGEYSLVAIVKPQQNENIHSATLNVLVEVKPSLFKGDVLELYMDGQKVASSRGSFNFTLHHVDRGTHSLTVKVSNQQGDVVASSEVTMVHVHRPFIRKVKNKPTFTTKIKNFFGITSKTS